MFRFSLFACFLFSLLGQAGAAPNIVIYISDDLGRLETSIHGSTDVKTPSLERLAANGMIFENAYVASPSCCPNRFSLLTGLMPAKHGAHANHSQPKPTTEFLLPELQKLGYQVASFGKVAHGRNKMVGVDVRSMPPVNLYDHVSEFMAKRKSQKPLCILIGDRRPHVPWTKELAYDPAKITLPDHFIDTPETRRHWARYLTDISGMDRELGKIYDLLDQQLGEDTIFLFTSDHGGQWPLGKWTLYDSGTRVPFVVSWPGKIAKGKRTLAMTSWVDILPTMIELVGGTPPTEIDGKSFAKVLLGEKDTHREVIFTTHTGDGEMNIFPIRSVRKGDVKYILNLRPDAYHTNHSDRHRKDGAGAYWHSWDKAARSDAVAAAKIKAYYTRPKEELFDLKNDPREAHNLVNDPKYQNELDALRKELKAWVTAQGDDMKPHREPYPNDEPLPVLVPKKR